MLYLSKCLFEALNDTNILYCHWKSNARLWEGLCGDTDLDLLVSEENARDCAERLTQTGFIKAIIQFGSSYPNVEEWLGLDKKTGRLIHVHLHYALVTGQAHQKEYTLPWADEMLANRVLDEDTGVYIASPAYELVTLKCRIVLKMAVALRMRLFFGQSVAYNKPLLDELQYLRDQTNDEALTALSVHLFGDKSALLTGYLCGREKSFSLAARKESVAVLKAYRRYGEGKVLLLATYYNLFFFFRKIAKKIGLSQPIYKKRLREKGALIAFVGADGCGKSTITLDTKEWLSWKLEATRFYLGSGDHYNPLGKRIMKGIQRKRNTTQKNHKKSGEAERTPQKTVFLKYCAHVYDAFFHLSVARHCIKMLKRADAYRGKGGIALLDRYPQVQYEGINDGPKIAARYSKVHDTAFFRWLMRREHGYFAKMGLIKPDLVFKLYVSPEESVRRKPDHDYDEVARKVSIVERLSFEGADLCTVSTEQPFEDEIVTIRNKIWETITE